MKGCIIITYAARGNLKKEPKELVFLCLHLNIFRRNILQKLTVFLKIRKKKTGNRQFINQILKKNCYKEGKPKFKPFLLRSQSILIIDTIFNIKNKLFQTLQ